MEILITGDFCPINRFTKAIKSPEFVKEVRTLTTGVDYAITNLECPLTANKTPIKKTGPAIKSDIEHAKSLEILGFNVVTLANNHIMDYGAQGYQDTLSVLESRSIIHVGAGNVSENNDVIYLNKDNFIVAIVNFCENEWSTLVFDNICANGFSEINAF